MLSAQGEIVNFEPVIALTREQEVDKWMQSIEKSMKNSLKIQFIKALEQFSKMPLNKWVFEFPAQIVLTVEQVRLTRLAQKAVFAASATATSHKLQSAEQQAVAYS